MEKKIAIFKDLGWFDDSFYGLDGFRSPHGWTVTVGEYETDGDIATLRGEIQADLSSLSSNDYSKLIASIPGSTGKSLIKIWDGSTWITVKPLGIDIGDIEETIPAGKTMRKIAISSMAGPVKIDYVGIANDSPIIDEDTIMSVVVDETSTYLSAQARIKLNNKNKIYNDVEKKDRILVWLGDPNAKKIFGGRIEHIERQWPQRTASLVAYDLGRYSLSREFADVIEYEVIDENVTTLISTVTYESVQAGEITLHGFETLYDPVTGNELGLSIDVSKTSELRALEEIAKQAADSGRQPDMRIDPTGDLVFHLSGSVDSGKTLTGGENGNVISNKLIPTSKIINKVILWTPNMIKIPPGGDEWTQLASPGFEWVALVSFNPNYIPLLGIYPDKSKFTTGGISKHIDLELVGVYQDDSYLTVYLDMGTNVDISEYKRFIFDYYASSNMNPTTFQIRLTEDLNENYGSSSIFFDKTISITYDEWQTVELEVGPDSDVWNASVNAAWGKIRYIVLRFTITSLPEDIDFWFDHLHFSYGLDYYTESDQDSIDEYGLEVGRYQRDDIRRELDAEGIIGQIIAMNKDPRKNNITVVKGDAELVPGENILLDIDDEDLNEYFRMTRTTQRYERGRFTTNLNLTATATAYWMAPSTDYFGTWRRMRKWATLGADILPIWG